ncbi:hypothetical protein GCM10010149_88890 [Nonomuraea roseoviolacea subsp. roseoviolacea]|uniref:hypothetical protein n=1 Tax=Nonomuraea roseoviolacea TaxID=103837 RepID=UPI0031D7FCD1
MTPAPKDRVVISTIHGKTWNVPGDAFDVLPNGILVIYRSEIPVFMFASGEWAMAFWGNYGDIYLKPTDKQKEELLGEDGK